MRKKFLKMAAASLAVTCLFSTTALAGVWHYGHVDGGIIECDTRMLYDYSDNNWCRIDAYSASVSYIADGYSESKINNGHQSTTDTQSTYGWTDYTIFENGETIYAYAEVRSFLDIFGQIDEYMNVIYQ